MRKPRKGKKSGIGDEIPSSIRLRKREKEKHARFPDGGVHVGETEGFEDCKKEEKKAASLSIDEYGGYAKIQSPIHCFVLEL